MGVFARLLRRWKATEEVPAAEKQADTPAAGSEAEEAAEGKGTAEAGAGEAVKPAATEAAEDTDSDGVEIPRQQSADEAVDNEAGEGART
ncbi:hypothetical protein [Streptomyces sp. S.PNR 29]|uniref:hypothetical protein n=1 Tax=Streptomyces sp. S.PNR 29 TaxID=2973805 RepID=UPI0025AF93CF|nr:hypothetical protein [Streptomyces sp. S.PNR 29]MDN0197557.1 hypothetical protein [Streptomyces sp. S.PNR 29]